MAGILINVAISNYYMIIAMLVLGYAFMKLRKWYIASAKDIKHLEGIGIGPSQLSMIFLSKFSNWFQQNLLFSLILRLQYPD